MDDKDKQKPKKPGDWTLVIKSDNPNKKKIFKGSKSK